MSKKTHEGILVDEDTQVTFQEFCSICGADQEYVIKMVELGILYPEGENPDLWEFSVFQLQRFRKAQRLRHGLKLNLSGVALGLELLEEIEKLENKIKMLEHQLKLFHLKL